MDDGQDVCGSYDILYSDAKNPIQNFEWNESPL